MRIRGMPVHDRFGSARGAREQQCYKTHLRAMCHSDTREHFFSDACLTVDDEDQVFRDNIVFRSNTGIIEIKERPWSCQGRHCMLLDANSNSVSVTLWTKIPIRQGDMVVFLDHRHPAQYLILLYKNHEIFVPRLYCHTSGTIFWLVTVSPLALMHCLNYMKQKSRNLKQQSDSKNTLFTLILIPVNY
jgi:hypothetical protein